MASSANPNPHQHQQQQPITPFDMQTFFNSIPQSQTPTPPFPSPYSFPPQSAPFHHHQQQQQQQQPQQQQQHMPYHHHHPQFLQNQNAPLLHSQRSLSYPTPPLQPPITISTSTSSPSPSPNPNSGGARLMALLGNIPSPPSNHDPPPQPQPQPQPPQHYTPPPTPPPMVGITLPPPPLHTAGSGPIRMPSSKLPKGRHLVGEYVVYDVDVRLQGESPPQQLEVTPITKYQSDPQLVVGRQIAVNKAYICYGLRQGNIRVLNINTALRSLLRGHTQV